MSVAAAELGLVERFAAEHFVLNSISEPRQTRVLAGLRHFEAYLDGRELKDATPEDLNGWQVSMLNAGLLPSTVSFYLRSVTPFYSWAWRNRVIDAEQYMRLREIRPPRGSGAGVPRPYSRRELIRLWEQLEAKYPYTTDLIVKRFRNGSSPMRSVKKHAVRLQLEAIIELALACGLRQSEIYQLTIDDLHPDNKYLVVSGKRVDQNPKVREVPYPTSTRKAIRNWLRFRGYMGATGDHPWCSITGPDPIAPLTQFRMRDILSFGDWQLHRLRHTCATERLRAGMELEKLQRFLGHADIAQTMRYAQLVRGDIHKSSERIDMTFQKSIRPDPRAGL
jgi:integrase